MKIKRGGRPDGRGSATLVLTTLAILSLVLVGGTYLRMQTASDRTTERNLRELERIGRAVEGQVDNLSSVLSGIARQALDNPHGDDSIDAYAARKASLVHGLGEDVHVGRTPFVDPSEIANASEDTAAGSSGETAVAEELHPDELGERRTYMQLVPGDSLLIRHQEIEADTTIAGSARWSLDALKSLLVSEYFATVVLANTDGTVFLTESADVGLRVQNLSGLRTVGDTTMAPPPMPPPAASEVVDVEIAGRSYVAFRQPIRLRLLTWPPDVSLDRPEATGTDWILAGLVPADQLRRESMSLGPVMLLSLSGLVILGMLLAPFVSVALMGPRERPEHSRCNPRCCCATSRPAISTR